MSVLCRLVANRNKIKFFLVIRGMLETVNILFILNTNYFQITKDTL